MYDLETMSDEELQDLFEQSERRSQVERNLRNDITRIRIAHELDAIEPSVIAKETTKKMVPMDDIFFNKMGEKTKPIEEVISTILGIQVEVLEVVPQYTITGLRNRGIRLDSFSRVRQIAKVRLGEDSPFGPAGAIVNVEVQKDDNDDHEYRVYYNGASIIVNNTPKGIKFAEIPRAIVIFISAFDVFGKGRMYYEMRKYTVQDKIPGRSPVTEIYINAKAEDRSTPHLAKVSDLMKVCTDPDKYDNQFPEFSERKRYLRETEEGRLEVSKEYQRIIDEESDKKAKNAAKEQDMNTKRLIAEEMLEDHVPLDRIIKYTKLGEAVVRSIAQAKGMALA